jgi:hypothetical protein
MYLIQAHTGEALFLAESIIGIAINMMSTLILEKRLPEYEDVRLHDYVIRIIIITSSDLISCETHMSV